MIDKKEYLAKNLKEINKILNDKELQEYLNWVFQEGISQHKKRKKLDGGYEIETYPAAEGFSRVQEIGNVICNKKELWPSGFSADTILGQKIPLIKIKNIICTIKSTKNIDALWKKPSDYTKKYSRLNSELTPQLNLITDELEDSFIDDTFISTAKYYGILAYKLGADNKLEYMRFIFLSETAHSIVHEVEVPVILQEKKIEPENKSMKENIELAKGESLKNIIKLR